VDATEWLNAYALRLGVDLPTEQEMATLLDLAGVAAHASERVAAPIACWLTARAGLEPEEAIRRAREVSGDG
jgi:hypothetical protein